MPTLYLLKLRGGRTCGFDDALYCSAPAQQPAAVSSFNSLGHGAVHAHVLLKSRDAEYSLYIQQAFILLDPGLHALTQRHSAGSLHPPRMPTLSLVKVP